MNFLIASYAYSEGGVSTDPSLPIQGAELTQNTFVLAYARALNVFGKSGKLDLILPFSELSGTALQAHVSYDFGRGIWAAVDGTYYLGARTTINGISENNVQENSRVGVTFALPVNKHNSIKLYVSTGLSSRTGSNFTTGGIAWQYRWGGGL